MSTNVLFTGSNLVGSNRLKYNFPSPLSLQNMEVSLTNLSIYNSWPNCSAALGTNFLQLKFPTSWSAPTTPNWTTYDITIDDSFLNFDDLSFMIQAFCISRGLYLRNSVTGTNIYFVSLIANTARYACQLNVYYLPTASQATALNWVIPSGSPLVLATSSRVYAPQWIISTNFNRIIGFSPGTYPAVAKTIAGQTSSNYTVSAASSALSDLCPQVNAVSGIIIRCSLIQSDGFSIPNDILQLVPITAAYSALNQYSNPSESSYATIINNKSFSSITLDFYDQDMRILPIFDTQLGLTLNIRKSR